jgi:anti-sigma B factor antagonist
LLSIERSTADTIAEAPFSCALQRRGRTSEIVLEGELDLAAKPVLDDAIAVALESGPIRSVIVDLTRVQFADSTTMTWLMRADAMTTAAGGRLIALAESGPVLDVLRMTGIDQRLTLVTDGRMP